MHIIISDATIKQLYTHTIWIYFIPYCWRVKHKQWDIGLMKIRICEKGYLVCYCPACTYFVHHANADFPQVPHVRKHNYCKIAVKSSKHWVMFTKVALIARTIGLCGYRSIWHIISRPRLDSCCISNVIAIVQVNYSFIIASCEWYKNQELKTYE